MPSGSARIARDNTAPLQPRYVTTLIASPPRFARLARLSFLLLAAVAAPLAPAQSSDTPITRSERFAGRINFVSTGGSLRTQPNTGDACALSTTSTQAVTGIPAGTSVLAAYLYWGASAGTTGGGGTQIDNQVTLNGSSVTASRTYTATYDNAGTLLRFFGGVANVTSLVSGNGSFTFGGLTANAGTPHCAVQAVVSGWALVVIYQGATQRLRAINIFDGLQFFRGSALTLTPDGFRIPPSNIDGRIAVVTWEGDPGNSGSLNGFAEGLLFNGSQLDDGLIPAGSNPSVQQFDGTVNSAGVVTSHGVDVDTYDVSSRLSPGQSFATTVYSSGGDLVLLGAQIVSATSDPRVDLALTKTAVAAPFSVGSNAVYNLTVSNLVGTSIESEINPVTVTDTLPAGLSFVSATGTGWSCSSAAQTVNCSRSTVLLPGQSYPPITLTVAVGAAAAPSVANIAVVGSASFDAVSANNTASVATAVTPLPPGLRVQKVSEVLSDPVNGNTNPRRIPGAIVRYTISVTNSGTGSPDTASLVLLDPIPANTDLVITGLPGGPVEFIDGTPSSGLSVTPAANVGFTRQAGGVGPFTYLPTANAAGVDPLVTALRVAPAGLMAPASAAGSPGFTIRFRVRVR